MQLLKPKNLSKDNVSCLMCLKLYHHAGKEFSPVESQKLKWLPKCKPKEITFCFEDIVGGQKAPRILLVYESYTNLNIVFILITWVHTITRNNASNNICCLWRHI